MKSTLRFSLFLFVGFLAGCGHLDVTPESGPDRVVTGTVNLAVPADLPPDAQVLVRGVDGTRAETALRVLGEQTITRVDATPVPFRVEFRADEAVLRRGLNLEARISYGGRLRHYNVNAIGLSLGNIDRPVVLVVDPVSR